MLLPFLGLDYYCYYFTSHDKSISLDLEGVQEYVRGYERGCQGLRPRASVPRHVDRSTGWHFLGIVSF